MVDQILLVSSYVMYRCTYDNAWLGMGTEILMAMSHRIGSLCMYRVKIRGWIQVEKKKTMGIVIPVT